MYVGCTKTGPLLWGSLSMCDMKYQEDLKNAPAGLAISSM